MTQPGFQRIFISYARKDGAELALRLQRDLKTAGFDVWLDKQRIDGGASWTKEIERAIDRAQVVLAILTRGSYESDICRAEQLRSLRKGKKVIPLRAQPGADFPLHLESANYRDFTPSKSYAAQLQLLLKDIPAGKNAVALKQEWSVTHVTAPPLPRNYLARPDALDSLRAAVLADEPGPSIALTALQGMGGIGKTILAQALSRDEAVQNAFPDGIAWTTVGKEPAYNLVTRMQEVRRALGDEPAANEAELQCINCYRTILREKAALVIVDDVWRSADIEPFLADSPRSKLLFTTRDGAIANATGAHIHPAELLTLPQSLALLAKTAETALPSEAPAIVTECGHLPLALSMVGAMLRGKPLPYWGHVLTLLQRADLEKIRAQFPWYPHTDMLRAIQVSVEALEGRDRQRYLALAVLLEDMAAAPAVQQTLWNVDAEDALETAERFVDLSLAQRDGVVDGIRLHDLQLDYVRAQYPEREALDLIHEAVRLSGHIIDKDPRQFASQVVGRLLPHRSIPRIQQFIDEIAAGAPVPWIRALHPALHPSGTALQRTLEGHSDYVNAVALTPDGKRAVSASWDKTLKVWDLDTGRVLRTLEGHSAEVNGVAVTPDGRRAVSASGDATLKVWDLDNGRTLCTLEGHSDSVNGVALTPDGKRAVSASSDKTLKIWDLNTGRALRILEGHSDAVNGVAVTPDGKWAVSASEDKTLKVWNLDTGRAQRTLEGHSFKVTCVAVKPDGQRAVSTSWDKTLKVWDLDTGRALHTLEGHSTLVTGVAVTPDGKRAISASWDQTLKVWDLDTGRALRTLEGHSKPVRGVAVTPDGKRAVSSSNDYTLKVWALEKGYASQTLEGRSSIVNCVAVTVNGNRIVSASWYNTLKVWDPKTFSVLRTLKGHSSFVNAVAVTPDGKRAVSASSDKTLIVWDLDTGRALRTLEGHSYPVKGVAVTPDGKRAVSGSADRTLKVWDLKTGRALRTLEGHSDWVASVAVTSDGKRAISASDNNTLKLWALDTGCALITLVGHSAAVGAVAVTPDGKRAVSASWDRTLKVWDLNTGHVLRTLEGHSNWVRGVAVTPNSNRAVSASEDKTLKVWDLETGLIIATFHCDAPANCCAFIDDQRIVAGDAGGRLYFLILEDHP